MLPRIRTRLTTASLLLTLLAVACKKDSTSPPGVGGGSTPTIITNSKWKVVASHALSPVGVFGLITYGFDRESATALRWSMGFNSYGASIQSPTELVVNAGGSSSVRDLTTKPFEPAPLKCQAEGAEWKLVARPSPEDFALYRDDQPAGTFAQSPDGFPEERAYVNAAADGFFVTGPDYTGFEFSFYSFAAQRWQHHEVVAERLAALRYAGTTYAVGFDGRYSPAPPELIVWKETGSTMQEIHREVVQERALNITNATVRDHYAYVTTTEGSTTSKFIVYKIDLDNGATSVLQAAPVTSVYPSTLLFAQYNVLITETDEQGNLYVVENRIENTTAHYSIRKYNVGGVPRSFWQRRT